MSEPLDIQALAKETADQAQRRYESTFPERHLSFFEIILSALTKLAADKDAESTELRLGAFNARVERDDALDNLARHKAALTVACDALKVYARMGYPGAKDALQQIDTLLKP